MKEQFSSEVVSGRVLVIGASEEERCTAIMSRMWEASPEAVVVFDYCGRKDKGALDFIMSTTSKSGIAVRVVKCSKVDGIERLRSQIDGIQWALEGKECELVFDFSVIPRGDLWMLLRWLTERSIWERALFLYSEPADYSSVNALPLTCGLKTLQALVGEAGLSDCSRPVHLVMQLGYEGDQALAVYEETQPARVSLLIPHPPFRSEWSGRTESFNSYLLELVGDDAVRRVDALDPEVTASVVRNIIRGVPVAESTVVCPLGTKPQLLGLFAAVVSLEDEPAVLIPTPLRAASTARARGVGRSWALRAG